MSRFIYEHVRCGKVKGDAVPVVDRPKPAALVADAANGFAHPAINAGFDRLVSLAKEQGIACLAIRNSYNCGVLGWHPFRLAQQGLLAIGFVNAPASIAPAGGQFFVAVDAETTSGGAFAGRVANPDRSRHRRESARAGGPTRHSSVHPTAIPTIGELRMTSTSSIRDVAMKGAGYYSRSTVGAKDVIDNATPLVLEAANAVPVPEDGRPITVADMGCADGGTSMEMIGKVLSALRRRAPGHPIQLVYTDLPRNDFSQLFQNVHGLTDLESALLDIPDLYVFASGTSFHKSMFPPDSLHLGFSATASHYISEKPCEIPDHVHMVGASGTVREAYEAQGARDWEDMLLLRARELVPGGHLTLFNFGIDEEGRYLGNTGGVSMFDTFSELWRELADEGTITLDEYRYTNFAQCYRTVDQFCAPLTDERNPVFRAGLRLKHVETRVVRCPYERDFADRGDAGRFAVDYIPTLRSWSEHTFVAGLSPARPAAEKQAIVDRFYDSYEDRVRQSPEGHAMDYVHIYLVCEKV